MALLETVVFTLGSSIAKAVVKSWAKDGLIADILPDLIDAFKDRGVDALVQRHEEQHIATISGQVAERIRPAFAAGHLDQPKRPRAADPTYRANAVVALQPHGTK